VTDGASGSHDSAPEPDHEEALAEMPGWAAFATLGITIAVCVGVGVGLGLWADAAWGSSPWGLFVGLVSGAGLAVMSVVKLVRRWL
jgi:F0F1-type ATP synthase assembly protein I